MNTAYEPDCDYVDGVLEERSAGLQRHSRVQASMSFWLHREAEHSHTVLVEQRVQISRSRVRIPDICLVARDDNDEVIQRPPALWIEILSPEDRWGRIQSRLNDALAFGVRTIWIIDPYSREAWIASPEHGTAPVEDGILRCETPKLEVSLAEILPED